MSEETTKMFDEMVTIKAKVTWMLEKYPRLRDSDPKLLANFWVLEIGKDELDKKSPRELLKLMSEGFLTSSESICRVRRKIQEQRIDLRGETYDDRQNNSEIVSKNIHDL